MNFPEWLNAVLDERGWTQSDLIRHARMSGYKLSSGQLSHILNETRQAGPEACIAIAYALNLPREEVFRARGWLLREPEEIFGPDMDPRVKQLAEQLNAIPFETRQAFLDALERLVTLVGKKGAM